MKVNLLPPVLLAYIGDGVYELKARTWLYKQGYRSLNRIHQAAINLVNASAQARGLKHIEDKLTEAEAAIVRRGKNASPGSFPRNTSIMDYRLSTGLEALFGYHYLRGDEERLDELWNELIMNLSE